MPTFVDPLKRALQIGADRTAILFEGSRTTYRELWNRCGKLAGMVAGQGAVPGDRIAILADNSPQYLEMYVGLPAAGFVIVPLNTRHAEPELRYALEDAEAKLLIADRDPGTLGELVDTVIRLPDEYETLLAEASAMELGVGVTEDTLALFWTVRAFLPSMIEQDKGHVVTIASAASLAGAPKLTDYCSSKFAAFGFDESLRLELKKLGSDVKTTIVCPYYIDTGMFDGVKTRFSWLLPILQPEAVVSRIVRAIKKDRRRLVMPWFIYSSWLSRLMPVAWYDALMDFFGVTRSMDEFHGGGD